MASAVAVPGTGAVLDARMALALNVHTCPGVYAVLLGRASRSPRG
ncbi:hypothetical protein OG900_38815 [Streptomyces sp. NBC_00433]